MKATRSFLMTFGLAIAILALPGAAAAQWCDDIDGPYWCGDPDSCEQCELPGWDVCTSCDDFGTSMTCGEYYGSPANDVDDDGTIDSIDNCRCLANPNQYQCPAGSPQCGQGSFVYDGPTMQLCYFDPDTHFPDGVDVEIYTVDRYRDTSCYGYIDHYRKRLVASVHCGWHSQSTCEGRVAARVTELAQQGYYPTAAGDGDWCPRPRI